MVQLIEKSVIEFETIKIVRIHCKFCKQELANLEDVKSIKKRWKIKATRMSWEANFKIQSKYIICRCAEILGVISFQRDIYLLNKKSIEITY